MARKSLVGSLLTGIALGAAALFFSKEENRTKAKRVVNATVAKAKNLKAEYKKNPARVKAAVKKQVTTQGKKLAKKVVAVAKSKVRKLAK